MKLGGITITVINQGAPTGYDGVGDPVYGGPTLTVVNNCDVQQHTTRREISNIDVAWSRSRLFAPASAPLSSTSVVALGAFNSWPLPGGTTTFLVDGEPAIWNQHNGVPHHFECYLREQAG